MSILAALCLSFASYAQEKVPVPPTKIDPAFNADGVPTGKLPSGYEWKRYPGQQWQAYPIAKAVSLTATPFSGSQQAQPTATPDRRNADPGRDALAEVNAARAARGLQPFVCDDGLCQAALSAAMYRAERCIEGHCQNDFAHLPSGCSATAAGCAAWNVGDGWGACCTYDSYTYAGAAAVIGRDGRRYMHLFVR
jgi:hypothetical protein